MREAAVTALSELGWDTISHDFSTYFGVHHLCRAVIVSPNLLGRLLELLTNGDTGIAQSSVMLLSKLAERGDLLWINLHYVLFALQVACRWFCRPPPIRFCGQFSLLAQTISNTYFWAPGAFSFCKTKWDNLSHSEHSWHVLDADAMKKVILNSAIVPALLEMRRDVTSWHSGTVALLELGLFDCWCVDGWQHKFGNLRYYLWFDTHGMTWCNPKSFIFPISPFIPLVLLCSPSWLLFVNLCVLQFHMLTPFLWLISPSVSVPVFRGSNHPSSGWFIFTHCTDEH